MSLTDRRTVYGKTGITTPLWMWLIQRASGLLLGPVVFIHVLVPNAPFVVWLTALLLAIILAHGFIGLWRLAAMRRLTETISRYALAASIVFVVVIAVFGIALVSSLT
jgi:succinate dehydrogenase hydrophobic anchor subunit